MSPPAKTLPKNRYKVLWNQIRTSDKPVTVRCAKHSQERLIHQMQKYKSAVNTANRALGLPGFGRMVVERTDDSITFSIPTNGELF